MAQDALAASFSLVLALIAIALYVDLGLRLGRRHVSEGGRLANHAWQAWWLLLAASTSLGSVVAPILHAAGWYNVPVALPMLVANLIIIFAALWGLSYFLAFVATGKRGLWWPIAGFYLANVATWVYVIIVSEPSGIDDSGINPGLAYARPLDTHPLFMLLLLGLVLPSMAAAAAYGWLGIRASDHTVRIRIAVTAASIFVWFGASLAASAIGLNEWDGWPLTSRIISLLAATAVWLVHFPPVQLARRLAIRPAE